MRAVLRFDLACAQRLIEMKAMTAERTRGERDRKERRRQEREAAKLQQQCADLYNTSFDLPPVSVI
jgi:hypothetical protein